METFVISAYYDIFFLFFLQGDLKSVHDSDWMNVPVSKGKQNKVLCNPTLCQEKFFFLASTCIPRRKSSTGSDIASWTN